LFTSGTAGAPRAAILTHGSLLANLEQVQQHPGLGLRADDVALGVLPCFHIFGLNVALGLPLFAGASVALVEHFHSVETLQRVRTDGVTTIAAVPAIYDAWLALDERDAPSDAFASVRLAVSGAAALPAATAHAMRERFGVVVHEGYGLTEASPVVSTSAVGAAARVGSIGPALRGVDVRLVDLDGSDVLLGDPGEIWVRGANVFAGYWADADATERVLTPDGWLRTGDIAVASDDGWLTLVDRAKDLIIVSGFNVFPAEVEEVLVAHPDVAEAAVIGEPHPRTGETVVAFVVAAPGRTIDRKDLLRLAQTRLARYKLPTRVEVVDTVPRTFGGKVVRRMLAARRNDDPDATAKPA
jgi:long-chain acyl-CoA synthetase